MMTRKSYGTRIVCAVVLALTACRDLPTAVAPPAPARSAEARAALERGLHLGQSPLVCVLGRPAPAPATGWQTRRDTIFLPRSEYDARGPMVRYFFWRLAPGGGIAHTASCTVPYSEAALRRVDRHFGVERGGGADQFVVRQEMLTTQSCVEDENTNACVFDPLVVTAPPREDSDPCVARPHECTDKFGSGSENWWSDPNPWGGGGSGGNPPPPENTDPAKSYEQGPLLWGACVLAMVGSTYSISQVAGKFETWYKAYRDAEGAQRLWLAAVENNAEIAIQMQLEYQYKQARLRQEDSAGAVSEATHTTYFALFAAAAACGATALIPSP